MIVAHDSWEDETWVYSLEHICLSLEGLPGACNHGKYIFTDLPTKLTYDLCVLILTGWIWIV